MRRLFLALVFICLGGGWVYAEPTVLEVEDSFISGRPFGARAEIRYDVSASFVQVNRELICLTSAQPQLCPAENTSLIAREFDARRIQHRMIVDTRFGIYQDLELGVELPIVLLDQVTLGYAPGVGPINTLLGNHLTPIPFAGPKRGGLGDITLRLRGALAHHQRHPGTPALVMELAYTLPSAPTMRANNANVGSGVHGLALRLDTAYPAQPNLHPRFGVAAKMFFVADEDLYVTGFKTQGVSAPGPELGVYGGLSIFAWRKSEQNFLTLDLRGDAQYSFEGRSPTIMFEPIGTSQCSLNPQCSTTSFPATGSVSNGITHVQGHMTVGGSLGVRYRFHPRFEFIGRAFGRYSPSYFLSYGVNGVDLDGNGQVETNNALGQNEFSPVYAPGLDEPGQRLKASMQVEVGGYVGLSGRY